MSTLLKTATATIADSASLSSAIPIGGMVPVGVLVPASGWTTAAISFQGSLDGVTAGAYEDGTDPGGIPAPIIF